MQMDSRIILGAQPLNVLGAVADGTALAQQANQIGQQNALAEIYRTQGAGIMSGDASALNALAAIDPMAAQGARSNVLGMQSQQLGMDATRQNMEINRQQLQMQIEADKREAQAFSMKLSAAEREQAAQALEKAVASGMAAQSPEQWDAIMTQNGAPEMVGQFENRDAVAMGYMGIAEAFRLAQGPSESDQLALEKQRLEVDALKNPTQNPSDRYRVVGSDIVDIGADGGPKVAFSGRGQEEVVYGPDGKPILTRGPVGTGKAFTEGQSKDNVFATRAEGALSVLEGVADALTSRTDRMAEYVPLGLGREVQDEDFQVAKQAGDEFLQAILRKDTGAAITEGEQKLYGTTYLPQPGDQPMVLEAKKQARLRALEAIKSGMSPAQIIAQERALSNSGSGTVSQPATETVIDGYTIKALD